MEVHPAFLKARGIDIGDIITDHIHSGLMILQAGYTGKQ
jgi:hypothetical protein